ncbi:MAG: aldo/keto reductase [Acidobacteria bacterium]|nr:aldo/keto reductase [Acidobacteriota bacterium]NIM64354.1 aldo/keto reductase [Acidobacteriota bacterium]NIO58527.1 aldo/keto reductase [Acidobacteriota bacterium]NIQ29581.1 aldo/keto reductase [Acidobacteriota bacterium]NIQ84277.1 aldo/keto reductase [Acidobacteriota bacterium]
MRPDGQRRYELAGSYDFCRVINGGWQLSFAEQGQETARIVEEWSGLVEAGFTTFDVADIYSGVEQIAGRVAARFSPGEVQVHTKCVPDRSLLPGLRATDLEAMIDGSLKRIGVERLDLVQFHWWDFKVDGWIESLHTLDRLREAGKIRHLGVTNFDTARLSALLDAGLPVRTNQVQYSLLDRRPDDGLATVCRRRGVALLAYGTLAGGFMGERWIGVPRPDVDGLNRSLVKYLLIVDECGGWDAQQQRLKTLRAVAEKHGVDPAGVAVRWVLERASVAAAIVGASGAHHLERNERVFRFRLDSEDHHALERDFPDGLRGEVYGLERESGRHASIMRYELQQAPDA